MAQFMLFYVHGPVKRPPELSGKEMEARIAEYIAWAERARSVAGGRLSDIWTDPGRVLSRKGGDVLVSDGPFAETSEVVGGYAIIEAGSYDEAVELCRDHPQLSNDGRIVIRQIA